MIEKQIQQQILNGMHVPHWVTKTSMAVTFLMSLQVSSAFARSPTPTVALPAFEFHEAQTGMFYDLDAFKDMEALAKKATKSIRFDFYIYGGMDADRVTDILIQKHNAGLDVRVMLDRALGSLPSNWKETKPILKKLEDADVPVLFYSSQKFLPDGKQKIIDHNKYIAIDAEDPALREGSVGSTNFAQLFLSYHDLLVHIKGDTIKELADQFDYDWERAQREKDYVMSLADQVQQKKGFLNKFFAGVAEKLTLKKKIRLAFPNPTTEPMKVVSSELPPAPTDSEHSMVRLLSTGFGRSNIFGRVVANIKAATTSIDVMVHEFDEPDLLKELLDANQKPGMKIRVMMDPWSSVDKFIPGGEALGLHVPQSIPNIAMLDGLQKAGIQTRLYKTTDQIFCAHMKMMIVDGKVMNVGSANWTKGAWQHVAETNVEVIGGRAVSEALKQFNLDWENGPVAKTPTRIQWDLFKIYQKVSDPVETDEPDPAMGV